MINIAKVTIKGVIVSNDDLEIYQWFGIEAVSPGMVADQVTAAKGELLEVEINSGGGDVYAGSEIYTIFKEYKGDSVAKILGLAASAASMAAMGTKKTVISPTAQVMIHNASSISWGDYRDHQHEANVSANWNKSIANAYVLKTGLSEEEVLRLMDDETWLTAQQALGKGFVDEIMFDNSLKLSASHGSGGMLPPEVINRVRNELAKSRSQQPINQTETPKEPERTPQAPLSLLQRKMNLKGRVLIR